jgi:Tol biopolymer transport system component
MRVVKQQRTVLAILLVIICMGVIGYFFFGSLPSANPKTDRIAFISMSSFPRLSALFLSGSIYVMNVDSPGLTRIIRQPKIELDLAWSPQGDRIAYFDYGSRSLYVISTEGPSQPELLQQGTYILDVTWSPDGTKIAYSDRIGSIYILDLITKQVTSLLDDTVEGADPDWSPNGTKIVFRLNPWSSGPDSSIAVVDVDGSDLIQLTPDDQSRSPKWSPDGSQILFERDRNIYIMDADGTNVRVLIEDGKSYMPSWSPDGTGIVFVSAANQECSGSFLDAPQFCTNELRVMNADGSNVVVIRSKMNERYISPVWAPHSP